MTKRNNIVGVILAGGLSRRMDGNEKSRMRLGESTLIERVMKNLQTQIGDIIINANGDPERFSYLKAPVQKDTIDGFAGPLAGVLAGMYWVRQNAPHATHIITAAADTPFFPKDYVERMHGSVSGLSADIALATSDDRRHPVFGLWPVALHDELHSFLSTEENHKVMRFVDRYQYCTVDFPFEKIDPFFNVNTQEDLKRAHEILETLA